MSAELINKIQYFEENKKGTDYVLGDIHGRFDLVYENLKEVDFNPNKDRLFCVGDLIDRGPYSQHVIDFLKLPFVFATRGNHEDMLLGYFEEFPNATDEDFYYAGVRNGMTWFLDETIEKRKEIIEALYQLPLVIEVNTERGLVGLVHADVPKKMSWTEFKFAIENNDEVVIETALWGRTRLMNEIDEEIPGLGRLYVGHTVQDKVKKLGNVVALDTGAVFNQHLSMVNMACRTEAILDPTMAKNNLFNIIEKVSTPFSKKKK